MLGRQVGSGTAVSGALARQVGRGRGTSSWQGQGQGQGQGQAGQALKGCLQGVGESLEILGSH